MTRQITFFEPEDLEALTGLSHDELWNRKKDDELIAVPRALLLFLTNQTRDTVHIYQEWLKGNLVDIRSHSLQPTEQEGGQDGADTP